MNRSTSTLVSLGISAALIAAGIWFLFTHPTYFGYGDGRWIGRHHMMMGGGGMGVFMILFWVVLVAVVVLLISNMMTGRRFFIEGKPKPSANADAMEILKRRYASGEIDKHEYENMRQDLQ